MPLTEKTEKSCYSICSEERLHLPKGDGSQKDLKDADGFDWLESTELDIDKWKLLLNRLFVKQPIPQDED